MYECMSVTTLIGIFWICDLVLYSDMKKLVMLPQSDRRSPKISAIFCGQKWLKILCMVKVPFIYLLGHDFDCWNAFLPKVFVILFKSSTICRIFREPGSPRSPLSSCLSIIKAQISQDKARQAQISSDKLRQAQTSTDKPVQAQVKPRQAQTSPDMPRQAQTSPEKQRQA